MLFGSINSLAVELTRHYLELGFLASFFSKQSLGELDPNKTKNGSFG
jgi:hypothetical protein